MPLQTISETVGNISSIHGEGSPTHSPISTSPPNVKFVPPSGQLDLRGSAEFNVFCNIFDVSKEKLNRFRKRLSSHFSEKSSSITQGILEPTTQTIEVTLAILHMFCRHSKKPSNDLKEKRKS